MFENIFVKENIVHIGSLLYLAGFLFRDQLILRILVVGGDIVYVLYYYYAPSTPLWWGIFWSLLFITVNIAVVGRLIMDRTVSDLSAEAKALFEQLGNFTPGDFRRLLKIGELRNAGVTVMLAEEGKRPGWLYYVVAGDIDIVKPGGNRITDRKAFVGEVAFLLDRPASATVTVGPGTQFFAWEEKALKRLLGKKPEITNALGAAFNRNLAAKVAAAGPAAEQILPGT
ncbi:MAG: cyclic nucleotide-binding domain-containing protein [Rhizobiales bacterium]|nr:cyclic nucleotide-binding domain-containing protein [Hyphomicrobiales bacterium]MBI3672465.1 cyclic nucleotide-binding domain-containing protein [Hyphomicrobiales bacterium]